MKAFAELALPYLIRIATAVVVGLIGLKLIKLVLKVLERRLNKVQVDRSLHTFLIPLVRITLQILLGLTVAAMLGIEITTFAAVLGAAGFAVGLAFQGSLANFAGGVLILILKPFKVGHYIQAGSYSGTVREIQVFYTVLQTPDNQKVIIPNADLSNSSAVNYSAYETRRMNLHVPIAYTSDLKKAKEVLLGIVTNHPLALEEPAPRVVMGAFGEDGMIFYVRAHAKSGDYWTMYFELIEQIKEGLDQAGIEIPYRQLDVYLKK